MALQIVEQAGSTDVGRQRSANEDSLVLKPPFFAVADGMGGAKAGEVASAMATEAFGGDLDSAEAPEVQLARMMREANRRIYDLAVSDEAHRGMGTTLTAAKVIGDDISLGHVGDSRAYRLRDGELEQLTRDHSLVAELERTGQITAEAAEHHPQRSIITRALGPEPDVEVDTYTVTAKDGDVYLLCSDGLTGMVSDDELGSILRSAKQLDDAAETLVRAANQNGGRDNITVVLFRLGEAEGENERDGVVEAPAEEETIAGQITADDVRSAPPTRRRRRRPADADSDSHRRAAAHRRPRRHRQAPAPRQPASVLRQGVLRARRAGRRRCGALRALAAGLLRRHQRRRPRDALPGRALRAAVRPRALRPGVRQRRSGGRHSSRSPLARARPRVARTRGRRRPGPRAGARTADRLMSARTRELFGLLPVSLLVAAGFAAVLATRTEDVSDATLTYGAVFLGLCVLAHLFIRARLPDADPYMFPLAALLAAVGMVMIYRIDAELAREQAQWFVVGLAFFCATILLVRDHGVLERYRYTIAAASIALLLMPRLPGIGEQVRGAFLAIKVGPIQFQPAEFAKLGIIVFLASYLRETGDILVRPRLRPLPYGRQLLLYGLPAVATLLILLASGLGPAGSLLLVVFVASLVAVLRERPSPKHFGPLLLVWGLAMFMLIFIRDLGSSLMFFGGFLALLYVATGRLSLVGVGATMFFGGAFYLARNVAHVQERVDIWLDPFKPGVVDDEGYQIAQSLFAQADGGLFGQGFGQALLELPGGATILPAAHTDLIYSVLANEAGLFGAAGLLGAYLLLVFRGFKTALVAGDGFSKLLATGLTAVLALQVFVIVGGVTRVIPLTGVTLPFVSYGGSSIVANLVLLALLLIVSDKARAEGVRRGGLV